jgi:hypothetical protein
MKNSFTPRPEPVLSEAEGRLRGAISEPASQKSLKTQKVKDVFNDWNFLNGLNVWNRSRSEATEV